MKFKNLDVVEFEPELRFRAVADRAAYLPSCLLALKIILKTRPFYPLPSPQRILVWRQDYLCNHYFNKIK